MRRCLFALLLPLILALAECAMTLNPVSSNSDVSAKEAYASETPSEDCYLCGGGISSSEI